jgi:hypothetical protein
LLLRNLALGVARTKRPQGPHRTAGGHQVNLSF